MQLILVRHGRPHHVDDAPDGADPDLTPLGHDQAARLAADFGSGRWGEVAAVVSSTMRRAEQTARPVADALGLPLRTDQRLVELDFGWRSYGTIDMREQVRAQTMEALNAGRWGTETYDPPTFVARVVDAVEEHAAAQPEGSVVVVCHGGVINAYVSRVLRTERTMLFVPRHTSVTRVLALPDGYREVVSMNEAPHLGAPAR